MIQVMEVAARTGVEDTRLEVDFRAALGEVAWAGLPAAVQARFSVAANRRAHAYDGEMEVEASFAGWLFAQACRLIGTPLAPHRGRDVPVRVDVRPMPDGRLVWDRTYSFPGRAPVCVSSAKAMERGGGLMEVVRGGLGMSLALSVEDAALHFRSRRFFLMLAGLRLPIPVLLTPGHAHVIHTDEGAGWFRFTLIFDHPWLGRTLFQTGLFREP